MTDDYLRALRIEREGYVARGLPERVAQVDAELARVGGAPDPVPTVTLDPGFIDRGSPRKRAARKAKE